MDKYIDIADKIGTPNAITQELGEIIYKEIYEALINKNTLCLDFSNVESMISPFLNAAIGKLYKDFTGEQISKYLKMQNFPSTKNSTLNVVISNAKKYYKNQTDYEKVVKEVLNDE